MVGLNLSVLTVAIVVIPIVVAVLMAPVPVGFLVMFVQPAVFAVYLPNIFLFVPLAVVAVFMGVPGVIVLMVAVIHSRSLCAIIAVLMFVAVAFLGQGQWRCQRAHQQH